MEDLYSDNLATAVADEEKYSAIDLISYQNDGKYSMADFRKAGRS